MKKSNNKYRNPILSTCDPTRLYVVCTNGGVEAVKTIVQQARINGLILPRGLPDHC